MNLQQFLSEQPIDKLLHQYFSLEGQSDKVKAQQLTLINSILMYVASNSKFTFDNLYQECQYQLEVNNNQRDAVNKLCRLLSGVVNKANYLMKIVQIKFFVEEVLQFLLSKVFVTLCSADCIKCIWALVNAYTLTHPLTYKQDLVTKNGSCCSPSKSCCSSVPQGEESGCCGGNTESKESVCCQSSQKKKVPQLISQHEKISRQIIKKFLKTFKLHVKAYPFKVRKDIFKLMQYILKFIKFSQEYFLKSFSQSQLYERQHFQQTQSQPLFTQIGITKQQLIELSIKNLSDEKDPRNMQLIFQNYLLLTELFSKQIELFGYKKQIFQNIEVYYPLSMEGDQEGFVIDEEDRFSEGDLRELLDQCLLHQLWKDEVREMLIEKMLAPPIHQYVSLYVKYITKFNPNTYRARSVSKRSLKNHEQQQQQYKKYSVLTMNLLHRLCEQQYLEENYSTEHQTHEESGCCSNKQTKLTSTFSISELIATIVRNVFVSIQSDRAYEVYLYLCEQKFLQFLNGLLVVKLFNHFENNKHAGTIIDVVKTILNPQKIPNVIAVKSNSTSKNTTPVENKQSCCSSNQQQSGCCSSNTQSCSPKKVTTPPPQLPSLCRLVYGKKINYEEMLVHFIILKFMQYWSAKGDVAFKLGLLIIALNKKLENISIEQYTNQLNKDERSQNLLEHLLITLGNVYENFKTTDQIKIMVLKVLMIIGSIYKKLYPNKQQLLKNINKIKKINNSIVHKDCINFSKFLNAVSSSEYSQFSKSDQPILKSYIDYIMEIYISYASENETLTEDASQMIDNIFEGFPSDKQGVSDPACVRHFDVKLYAAVRYLSILSSNQSNPSTSRLLALSKMFISLLFSQNKQANQKLISLIKYYNYPTLVSLFSLLFSCLPTLQDVLTSIEDSTFQTFFINVSLIGKILSAKFQQHYTLELQSPEDCDQIILNDLKKAPAKTVSELCRGNKVQEILIAYMLKKIWRKQLSGKKNQSNLEQLILQTNFTQLQEGSLTSSLVSSASKRIRSLVEFYKNTDTLSSLTIDSDPKAFDLQCTMVYVKYLQLLNKQNSLRFNPRLGQLYDAGMIQYFWNRLLTNMVYTEESIISSQAKNELIALIEYLPQSILVKHAQKIAPIIIYCSRQSSKNAMVEQTNEKSQPRDRFDYTKTQLISRLSNNLPEQSLMIYVLPYCLSFLKNAALSCQKGTDMPQDLISLSESIQATLNISKVVHVLIEKAQQKSEKSFKFQKLKKSLVETHKKQFSQYFGRLVYHKKRVIRQCSRNLLMFFQ